MKRLAGVSVALYVFGAGVCLTGLMWMLAGFVLHGHFDAWQPPRVIVAGLFPMVLGFVGQLVSGWSR